MEHFIIASDAPSIQTLPVEEPTQVRHDFDPLTSAASCLIALDERPLETASVEAALRAQSERVAEQDLGNLEKLLALQAHVLHGIFTKSTEKYAESRRDDYIRLHSAVALKSQNYCRMTIAALARIHQEKQALESKNTKSQNELLTVPATV